MGMIEFQKKIGKTMFYYGFTIEKKYNEYLKKLYGLSHDNLQVQTKLYIRGESYKITIRLVNQNRTRTRNLRPEELSPREVISLSYLSNQDLLSLVRETFSYSHSIIFDRKKKVEHPEFALFRIEDDGIVYCMPHLSKREKFG